ncbi:hypothetical protein C7444_10718 [Sphaerotilus hippei]|uniref:YjiS-like domain-containing protein n=1 Tax=Sphaerotilus hippei TaxID=744406 RepID=A0A318H336_9BURK|nr:DUF1127 domain-containing protein [Sphaerotilus hippei]PXW96112.1 hypothetical protein C7444_10718 [Sphaerotilus hippei]
MFHTLPAPAPLSETRRALRRSARHLRAAWLALRLAWSGGRRRRADRRTLEAMDDRELLDLGLGRSDIERIVAAPPPPGLSGAAARPGSADRTPAPTRTPRR